MATAKKPKANDKSHEAIFGAYSPNIKSILNYAIWAPSAYNDQPWNIQVISETEFHLDLTKFETDIYNLRPMAQWTTIGMFIENAKIAATIKNLNIKYTVTDEKVVVKLIPVQSYKPDPLFPFIKSRSVNRYPYKRKRLNPEIQKEIESILGEELEIHWFKSFTQRFKISTLLMQTTNTRLRIPETYDVHTNMIDCSKGHSQEKLPSASLGLSKFGTKILKWTLSSKKRNTMLMRLPGTTLVPQIELDLLPGLLSSAHFIVSLKPKESPRTIAEYIEAGCKMQRFWLTLTKHKMVMQPWFTTFIFPQYLKHNIQFTQDTKNTQRLSKKLHKKILDPNDIDLDDIIFTGRVGYPKKININRSTRKPLEDSIASDPQT